MAKSSQSVESLIKSTYALQVAVRCTEEVDYICQKNQLRVCELLKPFCSLSNNLQLKDVQGHLYNLRNVRVQFSEPPSEPKPDSKLRILLGEAVQATTSLPAASGSIHIGNVTTTATTPWFEAYKETYLDFLRQSDHETIKHYVSVILMVSSTCKDPVEEFSQLYTKQKQSEQGKHPKWLSPHIYYYYVLLHDVMDGAAHMKSATENYAAVRAKYGESSCCMLQINSCPPSPSSQSKAGPDIWAHHMRTANGVVEEDTDGGFKKIFHRKKKNKNTISNDAHQEADNRNASPAPTRPDQIREEPRLISDPETSLTSTVQPGDDPLSQLAANSRPMPAGEGLNERLPHTLDHNYHNHEEPHNPGSGRGRGVVQYGRCLSEDDHRNLRNFVIDLVSKKLLPHLNEVLKNLNEWLLSRRSVRRSFSNMLRGFSKTFSGPNSVVSDEASYASTSLEMQLRQLADIAFLLQSYELAFQSYHQVKKDFQSANAWLYYGGAVEMCAVTAYLLSSTRRDVVSYLEEAISVYSLSCKAPYYAIRGSLLLMDILKERGLYKDLTQLCVRMTAEDEDLRSAVCLEQAAHAFLRSQPSMPRKYALHLVLAGNRYARAAQRLHSLRAYQQAQVLYQGKGWTLAEDYVEFCLAKHSFSLHRLSDARDAFEKLLSHESMQSATLQRLHLQDYIYVHKQLLLSNDLTVSSSHSDQIQLTTPTTSQTHTSGVWGTPLLPLPFIKPQCTRVTFTTAPSPESLDRPLDVESDPQTKPRSSSYRDPSHSQAIPTFLSSLDELKVETMVSKSRSSSASGVKSLLQHLSQDSVIHKGTVVVGNRDYDPTTGRVGVAEWEELERRAAMGVQGTLHENLVQSVQMMDENTDNSQMPFTVVNESVAVGVVVKNPLKGVPLLMTNLCLIWDATPTSNPTPSSPSPPVAAVCEVVKRILLQPEEEKRVTLHITPKKEGELVVKGFLFNLCIESNQTSKSNSPLNPGGFKANSLTLSLNSRDTLYQAHQGVGFQSLLSEGVQGRVEFEVRGSRLNDSKNEKAGLVYSKDYRLHWRVTAPMPKIVVSMCGVPESLLAGEMTRVSVEVFNVGQVSLNSLHFTSSLGSKVLLDKKSSELHHPIYPSTLVSPLIPTHSPTPCAVSATPLPSGTFSRDCLELPLPQGRLEPGKGVKAQLVMQGPSLSSLASGGDIPWNILFYYEPALISANSRLSHRVLRHSCMLYVRESLQLRATAVHGQLPATPSSNSKDQTQRFDLNRLVVTVEAENKCQLGGVASAVELRVSQLSCVSAKWELGKLDREQGLLCLLPSESGVLHLKGKRLWQNHSQKVGLVYSDVPLGPTLIPSCSFPVKEVLCGSAAFSSLGFGPPSSASRITEGGGGERKKGSWNKEEIALIVFWQALVPTGTETVFSYGHHTITVPLPQSMAALRESSHSPSPYDLIKYYLEHPTQYHHPGFVKSAVSRRLVGEVQEGVVSLCRVPVNIILQNCFHQPVKVMVELLQPKDGAQQDPRKHSEAGFFWSGGCKRQLKMEGGSTHTLPVSANFCWPAVYNLNTVRVLAAVVTPAGGSGSYHVQRWHRTSHMSVVGVATGSNGAVCRETA